MEYTALRPSLIGPELRSQNFDLAKFPEIIPKEPSYGAFCFRTWPRNSKNILSRRPSSNSAQNFDQITNRALSFTISLKLRLEEVAPRFEEIQDERIRFHAMIVFVVSLYDTYLGDQCLSA